MKQGGSGGGRTVTGLVFEKATDLRAALEKHPDITTKGDTVLFRGTERGLLLEKHKLYSELLERNKVDWRRILSKQLLPDDAILVRPNAVLTVVEKKFQQVEGSVDEKLQTCDFKKKQYTKLLRPLGVSVQYCYVLSDWFQNPKYKDVLQYIESVGCTYFFDSIPIDFLGF